MKGFLIDTNVLSEYNRPAGPDPWVAGWLDAVDRELQFVSVITLAEIRKGIELLARGRRRSGLEVWLSNELEPWFESRVLPIDRPVAASWAISVARSIRNGRPMPTLDSLIAATAITHELTVVTRNVRDFSNCGVSALDPWKGK